MTGAIMTCVVGKTSKLLTSKIISLDIGCTKHLVSSSSNIFKSQYENVTLNLTNDSLLKETQQGTRTRNWEKSYGIGRINVSNTLVVLVFSMRLLSIPLLVEKNISVLFVHGEALFNAPEDDKEALCYVKQDNYGPFYIV